MVKKRGSSSSVTDKKPGTPKVLFKKIISPSKNAKKKQLTPFNKLINKKTNESKKPSWSSQGNIVEDENPNEVSKEKKKNTLSKDTKEPKTDKTGKNKIKPLKKCSSPDEQAKTRVNKSRAEELISDESPKKKKPDKLVKKTPVKNSSLLDKTAKKMTKKSLKTILKIDTKGMKKESGVPEVLVGKNKMPTSGGRKTRKSSLEPKAPSEVSTNLDDSSTEPGLIDDNLEKAQEHQPISGNIYETHSESCSEGSKVNENYPVPDSLVMSSPPKELSEPIVYGQGGEDEHSLGTNSEAGYQNPDGAEDMSPPSSPSLCTFNFAYLKCKWNEYVAMENATCNIDEDMVSTKSVDQEVKELDESESLDNEAASKSVTEENTELNTSEIQGEDMILTTIVDQEGKELEETESQDDQVTSNSVKEENGELYTSEIEGEDYVPKRNLKEDEDKDLVDTDSQTSNEKTDSFDDIDNNSPANKDGFKMSLNITDMNTFMKKASITNCTDEVVPKGDCCRMFLSPEKENSSPQKSTIEDDLCLSTSVSQTSSRSSILSSSVDELNKITKSKKSLTGPLSSKLPLKRKKEVASIGNGEIQRKKKCLDSTDPFPSPNFVSEPADHSETFEDRNSQISPKYHYRESEILSSRTSESSSGLSPLKVVKVVVKRLEEDDGVLIGRVPEISKGPRIPLKDCSVSLTKIDCKLNDMENVSPTSSLKCSTAKTTSCSQNNEIDFQAEKPRTSENHFQRQILCNKHNTFTEVFSNNSSAKDRSIALNSTEYNPQGAGKTYSHIAKKQRVSAKHSSNIVNNVPPYNILPKEEKSSIGTNNRSIKNDLTSSSFSEFRIQRTLVNTTGDELINKVLPKKPKLCKADLNLKRKQILKIIGSEKSKKLLNYGELIGETKNPASPTVDSPDRVPNRITQKMGNFQIPTRKVTNKNIAKFESSAEPYFKQPQVHGVGKVRNIITFENNEISRNKPSLSAGNSNVIALPSVSPETTVKTYHQNKNYWKTPEDYSVSLTDTLPQSNRHSEEDDTFSILSVDLHPALRNFVEDVLEPEDSRTYNGLRGNLSTKSCKAAQEISYEKRYTYNGYNETQKQGNEVCQLRTYTKEGALNCSQNQFVNRHSLRDDDKDEEGEEELINKKRVTNRNNAVENRKHIIDFRFGTPLKSVAEDQTVFPPSSSRSDSSISGSNNLYGSDNISYENLLHGTPFDGYCLFYLRNSVSKNQDHQCDLKHEVPDLLFNLRNETEKDELKRCTSKGINHVCREHCSNPPLRLLEGIIMFCIKNKQKQELTNVINFLKNSITVDKVGLDKYNVIWTFFTKSLVKNIVQSDLQPTSAINTFFQKIFVEGGQISEANRSILFDVLSDLAKLANTPSLRLMHCVKFLKDMKFPTNVNSYYPISFIEAVLRQVLESSSNPRLLNDKNSNPSVKNFVFLVYKTFFDNINDCKFIYNESRFLAEKFLNVATYILGDNFTKLHQLEIENGSVREPIGPWGLNIRQTNTEHMIRRPDNTVVPQQQRTNFMGVNNLPNTLTIHTIKDMAPKEVFDFFKSKSVLDYLEVLQKCEDYVKRKHADVTMSFLLLQSVKENSWNHCYSLFQEMIEFNPHIVKDFTNENNTPARRLLVIIFCCLNSHHIQDAVDLFLRFGLYEADNSKWLVDKSPEDIDLWEKVCEDLKMAFCNLSQFTETESKLFTTIIHRQKSLRTPVYLQTGLNNFFWKAANLCGEGCWNAMAAIVAAIVEEDLLKQLNLDEEELYRILVRAVCQADNMPDYDAPAISARLMKKSNKVCDIYPTSWARDCHELTIKSCLTVEELYAFFIFKIRAFKKLLELKSLHITFEEYNINPKNWKQPYFRDVDSSIKGAIDRFKIACRRIGLEPTSLIIQKNKITVDKVILQGTL